MPATIEELDRDRRIRAVQRVSRLLDTRWRIPGTRIRIGIDPLLGLLPGVGDSIAVFLSAYIIGQAWRLGASRWTLARMVGNVAADAVVGAVPLIGDLFDVAFKANRRNFRLLDREMRRQRAMNDSGVWQLPARGLP